MSEVPNMGEILETHKIEKDQPRNWRIAAIAGKFALLTTVFAVAAGNAQAKTEQSVLSDISSDPMALVDTKALHNKVLEPFSNASSVENTASQNTLAPISSVHIKNGHMKVNGKDFLPVISFGAPAEVVDTVHANVVIPMGEDLSSIDHGQTYFMDYEKPDASGLFGSQFPAKYHVGLDANDEGDGKWQVPLDKYPVVDKSNQALMVNLTYNSVTESRHVWDDGTVIDYSAKDGYLSKGNINATDWYAENNVGVPVIGDPLSYYYLTHAFALKSHKVNPDALVTIYTELGKITPLFNPNFDAQNAIDEQNETLAAGATGLAMFPQGPDANNNWQSWGQIQQNVAQAVGNNVQWLEKPVIHKILTEGDVVYSFMSPKTAPVKVGIRKMPDGKIYMLAINATDQPQKQWLNQQKIKSLKIKSGRAKIVASQDANSVGRALKRNATGVNRVIPPHTMDIIELGSTIAKK